MGVAALDTPEHLVEIEARRPPASGPRLRREEVAQLAGPSADYSTELERGRGAQPSAQVLAALGRALRLGGD